MAVAMKTATSANSHFTAGQFKVLNSPLPKITSMPTCESFTFAETTVGEVKASLIRNGGCIVRNLVDIDALAQLERELRPYLSGDIKDGTWSTAASTTRISGLAAKSKLYMDTVANNDFFQKIADEFLLSRTKVWIGDNFQEFVSKPQISCTAVFQIRPGAKSQGLHRDDMIHHVAHEEITAEQYRMGRDTGIAIFVAGKKSTKANGATRFQPGSHLQKFDLPPDESTAVYAELDPGDAFIMLTSCYHGGSANNTEDSERLIFATHMSKGYLRQEENQYMILPVEKAAAMKHSPEMLKKLGYQVSNPLLGWVDMKEPLEFILKEPQEYNPPQ